MNNRLERLFAEKDGGLLSVYFTAGYPGMDDTEEIILSLARHGADMIEVGVPFSDPMADGPVIQDSSTAALRNGMTMKMLFSQVESARKQCPDIPLVLMGYLNPMMQFGVEKLFGRCAEAGIDAVIIPDLPFAEYMEHFKPLCEKYAVPVVMLITPETSGERVRLIDENCGGFIYMVSAASTTGTRDSFSDEQKEYFRRVDSMGLKNRRLIGFGISNAQTFADACRYSSGAIIGSLFIKCLASAQTVDAAVEKLMRSVGCEPVLRT